MAGSAHLAIAPGRARPSHDAMPFAIWAVVAAAAASISLALGARQTFGLFLLPLAAEQGLSPAVLGAAVAFHNLVWG